MAQLNRLWILAGQSWMAGTSGSLSDLQVGYKDEYLLNTRIWNTDKFEPLYSPDNNNQYPLTTKNSGVGCEFYMKDIADSLGSDVYILKYAVGGTRLEQDAGREDWNVNSVGELYDDLVAEIALVETWMTDRGKTFKWEGVVWWQGEGDSNTLSGANAYGTNVTDLYNSLNTVTGETLKFYQYNIEAIPLGTNRPYLATVNAGKASFTSGSPSNRKLYDTNVTVWQPDDIHPSITDVKRIWDEEQKPLIIADI